MTEYTPEKVNEMRGELSRWKEAAETASARLKESWPEDDWQGLWNIERARVERIEADLARAREVIARVRAVASDVKYGHVVEWVRMNLRGALNRYDQNGTADV